MLQHCETRAGVQEEVRSADNLIGSSEPRPEIVSGQNNSDYELNLSQFLLFMIGLLLAQRHFYFPTGILYCSRGVAYMPCH